MQTNGTLLDEEAFSFCLEWKLHIGLSMDGPRRANDAHRVDHQGQSSFDAVERAVKLLSSEVGQTIWSGFLAVIDLNTDPEETYSYFKSFNPRSIEFLFPLGHYDLRPPGKIGLKTTPYADWLLRIFHVWYRERPQTTKIRRFRDVIAMLAGARSSSEEWGLQPTDFAREIQKTGLYRGCGYFENHLSGSEPSRVEHLRPQLRSHVHRAIGARAADGLVCAL